jgi:hypothetical protein
MSGDLIFAGLTTLGTGLIFLLIVIFAFVAWRIRRNMVIVLGSITVILVSSGFVVMDSWEHANSPLAASGAVVFSAALMVLGMAIRRLLSGMGTKPKRRQTHIG